MFESLPGLMIALIALLPGAMFVWAFEREVGQWGLGASDRLLRFLGFSALFAAAAFPPFALLLWGSTEAAIEGQPLKVSSLGLWVVFVPLAYLLIPFFTGHLAAVSVQRARQGANSSWRVIARLLAGRDPAPRAWDYLFSGRRGAIIRLELTTGERLAGIFGSKSYASGYPEEPQDLFLESALLVTEDGKLVETDDGYEETGAGLLIKWDNVKVLEFHEAKTES